MSEKMMDVERARVVDAMCMTWRHDFGLDKQADWDGSSGMTDDERDALRRRMGQLYDHHFAQSRASQPAGVPDGYAMVPVALTEEMRQAFNRVDVLRYPANNRQLFKAKHSWAAMLSAAPTVKAEHWKCEQCGASSGEACNANGCFANERSADEAPSLPAAGSDNAPDVLLPSLRQYRHNCGGDELIPGYDYDETNRIVAALSAQQSAPERVSVPRELLERAIHWLRSHAPSTDCAEWDTADELRALLSGAREGGV